MSLGSEWRKELAWRIAPFYASNPHVDAVLLGGSTASGRADRYSDIEIGVFWNHPPSDEERRSAIIQVGGQVQRLYPFDPVEEVWSDNFVMGWKNLEDKASGVLVELVNYRTEFLERVMDEVLIHLDLDLLKQNLLSAINDGIALHNSELVQRWKSRLAVYPDELAMAMIRHHAQIDHFWRWQMWLDRGPNLMMLYNFYAQIQQKILLTLLALNHVYYHGFKWLDEIEARLPIAPPDLMDRINQVFTLPPAEGAQIITRLVEETYNLVERQLPQVDVERLRSIFHYQRPTLDEPAQL